MSNRHGAPHRAAAQPGVLPDGPATARLAPAATSAPSAGARTGPRCPPRPARTRPAGRSAAPGASTDTVHSSIARYPAARANRTHSSTSTVPTPAPRADGSTCSSRSFAVSSSLRTQKIAPTRSPCSSATHAASRSGSCPSRYPAMILRDQRLVRGVPPVLLRVQRAVALDHPAVVARAAGGRNRTSGRASVRPSRRRIMSIASTRRRCSSSVELAQQRADLRDRLGVEHPERVPALGGQPDQLPPRVRRRPLAPHAARRPRTGRAAGSGTRRPGR